jgi:adenine-specific DNA-methyltransferase
MTKVKSRGQESLQLGASETGTTSVEKYEFAPIKGYPMLNWRGKRPFTSTQYYPAQLKEVHGEEVDGWRNKLFWGDNLQVMSHLLKKFRRQVDLVYIDPPFDSGADYRRKVTVRGKAASADFVAFEEKQYGDIWTNDEYLQFMYERLAMLRELLSPQGSIFVHCDPRRSHYLKLCLDEIFGKESFVNEIIWKRSGVHASTHGFGPVHDVILFYGKSPDFTWNPQYAPYEEDYIEEWFKKADQDGRKYGLVVLSAPGDRQGTKAHYEINGRFPPPGRHWSITEQSFKDLLSRGLVEFSSTGVPYVRKYLDESKGLPVNDIWTDTGHIKSQSKENVEYPTQKPERLLERIVQATTNPGSIVFDCFMGSGTTQAVAMKLGRRFIGADINLGAIQTTIRRLIGVADNLRQKPLAAEAKHYTGFELYNVNHYDVFRNPVQAKELLIEALEVQNLEFSTVFDGEKDGRMVKIMPVNRIATRADLNELIAGFDYKSWERKQNESPNRAVEKIMLVCMGHEPDLAAQLELAAKPFKIDVEVVDILRDKADLEFKRDSEAKLAIKKGQLIIERFYPMNLLQKLSLQKESIENWQELVESVLIDWNYDGAVLQPAVVDIPEENAVVKGSYKVPTDAGTIRVKITDLLSESWEGSISNGK